MSDERKKRLQSTVREIGFQDSSFLENAEIVDYAEPDKKENVKMYKKVNEKMRALLNTGESLGKSGYVTGEMGALRGDGFRTAYGINYLRNGQGMSLIGSPMKYLFKIDEVPAPNSDAFRELKADLGLSESSEIDELNRGKDWRIIDGETEYYCNSIEGNTEVYYPLENLYEKIRWESESGARELLKWYRSLFSHPDWKDLESGDRFNLLYTLAYPIDMYLLPNRASPHYLYFGNEYVQLQGEHIHDEPKWIWLIHGQKRSLGKFLSKVEEKKKQGIYLSHLFQWKLEEISRPISLNFLDSLPTEKEGEIPVSSGLLEDLKAIGFIRAKKEIYELTEMGKDFLKFMY